jgi:RNAse (barnase) inhibitor barstar
VDPIRYTLDGAHVASRQEFFDAVGEAVGGPGTYFGSNFDAFSDCLSGGFGTPEDRTFFFVLNDSSGVRERLGYPETLLWLRDKLLSCHPSAVEHVLTQIDAAELGIGETVFDILVTIFGERGVPFELE